MAARYKPSLRWSVLLAAVIIGGALLYRWGGGEPDPTGWLTVSSRTALSGGYMTVYRLDEGLRGETSSFAIVAVLPSAQRPFLVVGDPMPQQGRVVRFQDVYHTYPRRLSVFDSTEVVRDTVVIAIDLSRRDVSTMSGERLALDEAGVFLLDFTQPVLRLERTTHEQALDRVGSPRGADRR